MTVETIARTRVAQLEIQLDLCDYNQANEHYCIDVREDVEGAVATQRLIGTVRIGLGTGGSDYREAKGVFDTVVTTAMALVVRGPVMADA